MVEYVLKSLFERMFSLNSETKKLKGKKSRLSCFIDNNIYVLLAFLCSAVLMLLIYFCFDVIPFGDHTVLRMDLYHQYGPLFAELYDRLTEFKSLLYSWNTGGGGAFLGNYFNYLSSPIGAVIALIAGHENIPEAIGTMILVKNALASAAAAYYLKKAFGRNDFSISAFGLLYAFCGFFIAYYWNVMWIDAMYLLPLVVLGIENIINSRKCKLYTVTLALSFFSSYYMAYMICIFAVLYFLVYYFSHFGFKSLYGGNSDDSLSVGNKILYNRFLRSGVLFAASSAVAAMLVAFALLPTYFCLKSCSATSGSFPEEYRIYNNIFDFLANHLASVEPTIRSSGDTVLPNVYCGVLTVLLIPLYITCDKISIKERMAHILLLAAFFVCFNLNYANFILHAMHFPNDLPFRFSFIYSFVLIIMAYNVLMHIRDISGKAILCSGIGLILFTVLVEEIGMGNIYNISVYLTIGLTVVYTMVLALMRKKEYAQSAVSLLLMCCVFAEVAIGDTNRFSITQVKENFVNGYSDFASLKAELDKKNGTDKYRMELTDINTLMDASWFGYNGLSVFSSMAYEKSANLQSHLGMDSNYINSYIYHPQTPVYNAMMSLKYLVKNGTYTVNKDLYNFSMRCGDFEAYENKYCLPIAYCVGSGMETLSYDGKNPFELQNDFWYYATGMDGVFKTVYTTDYTLENISDNGTDFYDSTFNFTKNNADAEGKITLRFDIAKSQNIYLYFDCSEIENIEVRTQSARFVKNVNVGDPYIVDCGYCEEGDVLIVEATVPADKDAGYAECYVEGLDMDIFDIGYEVLTQGELKTEQFDDTYIKGKINASDNKMVYTSVNYDDGWTVTVDGKEVDKVKIAGALIGFRVDAGEHTVEMKYTPRGLAVGLLISALTAAAVIIFLLIKRPKGKKAQSSAPAAVKPLKISVSKTTKGADNAEIRPTGIDAMMAEDLGSDATVEQAEALLDEPDEYEGQLERNAPTLSRADELLSTQKLDLKAIIEAENKNKNTEE